MILACHNLSKSFGEHTIVRNGSFHGSLTVEYRKKYSQVA